MGKIISIHEYELRPGVAENDFENALRQARESGLLSLPGLDLIYFGKGIRGQRKGRYVAIWVYTDLGLWEQNWGPADQPISSSNYPAEWRFWEQNILNKYLDRAPDTITFTAYREF